MDPHSFFKLKQFRAMDPHSFFADPNPDACFKNADPYQDLKNY